jgi:hypothetical protein
VWPEKDERPRFWVRGEARARVCEAVTNADLCAASLSVQCRVPDAIARCRHEWMKLALRQWHSTAAETQTQTSNGSSRSTEPVAR